MGPLHVEMAYMSAIGDWVDGSGWLEAFEKANISTTGRIESFLRGSKVKRTRYAHQVSLATLARLSQNAFKNQQNFDNFEDWKKDLIAKNANACYWFQLIDMELLLFAFIRSLRDSDFQSFLESLKCITKWMFALDHTHYARWLPVFIKDLEALDSSTRDAFEKGYFTIKRSNRVFSNIGIDQAHEQNNKIVKIHGGAIGILDSQNALLRWSVSAPIIADLCRPCDDQSNELHKKNHEDTMSFERSFHKDINSLINAFEEMGNPFLEEEEKPCANFIKSRSKRGNFKECVYRCSS